MGNEQEIIKSHKKVEGLMKNEQEIINLQKEVEGTRRRIEGNKYLQKNSKVMLRNGLVALSYLGFRTLVGPEVDFVMEGGFDKIYQIFDLAAAASSIGFGLLGTGLYGISSFDKRINRKYLGRVESKLEGLTS